MLSIADLCPYWSYPPAGGGPSRVYHLNREVSDKVNIRQFSCRPTIGHRHMGWREWAGSRLRQITRGYLEYQYFNPLVLASGFLLYRLGHHSDLYLSESVKAFALQKLRRYFSNCAILQVEHPWLFALAQQVAGQRPIAFIAHNIEASLWEHPAGNNGSIRNVRGIEAHAARTASIVVAMSDDDAGFLEREYGVGREKLVVIPNGVDLNRIHPPDPDQKCAARKRLGLDARPVLLFLGSDHFPNREAVRQIQAWQSELGPRLNAQFLVVGTVGRYFNSGLWMRVEGYVDDVKDYLIAADVGLNPLLSGSGVSLKTTEYLAWGLPMISTPVGVRGLDLNGDSLMLGDAGHFPEMIAQVLSDPALRFRLSANGRRAVEKYSWERLAKEMLGVYERLSLCG